MGLDIKGTDEAERCLPEMRFCKYWQVSNLSNAIFKSNRLFLIHMNIRSLQNNSDNLNQLISSFAKLPDIICISETRLKAESIMKIDLPDYNCIEAKTSTNANGIYITNSLSCNINDKLYIKCEDCENLWIIVTTSQETFIVGAVYRHPRKSCAEFLKKVEGDTTR